MMPKHNIEYIFDRRPCASSVDFSSPLVDSEVAASANFLNLKLQDGFDYLGLFFISHRVVKRQSDESVAY